MLERGSPKAGRPQRWDQPFSPGFTMQATLPCLSEDTCLTQGEPVRAALGQRGVFSHNLQLQEFNL